MDRRFQGGKKTLLVWGYLEKQELVIRVECLKMGFWR